MLENWKETCPHHNPKERTESQSTEVADAFSLLLGATQTGNQKYVINSRAKAKGKASLF